MDSGVPSTDEIWAVRSPTASLPRPLTTAQEVNANSSAIRETAM
nr:hypothetical protein [Actinomadura madurae]